MTPKSFSSCCIALCLLAGLVTYAQPETTNAGKKDLIQPEEIYPREKIYVHSDKDFYLAGEIVWFKVYCVDENDQPIHASKVAYVEIMDRSNKAVLQAKIALDDNGGSGSFYLPLTLTSDHYVVRAYTNWMKNTGNQFFFEKTISIVNTTRVVASNNSNEPGKAVASFFPEGGQLVENVETTIAFRIMGKNGKGSAGRGIVIDNNGDTAARFSPYKFGIGKFRFTPLAGKNYKAIILLPEGNFIEQVLPAVEKYGYVMNVIADGETRFAIKIQARGQEQESESLFLIAHNGKDIKFSRQQLVSYREASVVYIDRKQLSAGVNYITLFDKDRRPVCERLIFIRPGSTNAAEINAGKNVYATRQPVDLSVLLAKNTIGDIANCSVSVFQADSLQAINGTNIASYLLLFSHLKGSVESPAWYFSDDAATNEAMDNLLLTHGWRSFRRKDNTDHHEAPVLKFIPEYNGHIITGRVINITTGRAVADAECSLSVPSSPFGFYLSRSDSTGMVRFEVKNYYGPGEIIAQVNAENKNNYRVDFQNPFSDDPAFTMLPVFSLAVQNKDILTEKSIAMQAQNIYRGDSLRKFILPELQHVYPFYGRAEFSYLLDDYKRFTTMEEVLREYVAPINVFLRDGKLHLSLLDESLRQVYRDNALVLLDGVPLQDYNKIFSYDPLKIKKLDVVPRRYIYGSRYYGGIASFESYDGKFDGFQLDSALVAVDYEGLQLQREFYSPVHDRPADNRLPDLRTTLYWQPQVIAGKLNKTTIRFYTSDQKGKFAIVLEGISEKGQPLFATTFIEVQ